MNPALWYLFGLLTIPAIVFVAVMLGTIWRNLERERQEWGDDW